MNKLISLLLLTCVWACSLQTDDIPEDSTSESETAALDDDEFRVAFVNPYVTEDDDRCCAVGSDVSCINDVGDVCGGATPQRVVCQGCDFGNWNDYCSTPFDSSAKWDTMNRCTGISIIANTGALIADHCSDDEGGVWKPGGTCTPGAFYGMCDIDIGPSGPNGCWGQYGAAQTTHFDGAVGRMCCEDIPASAYDYHCVPVEASASSTSGCSNFDVHNDVAAYCHPCPSLSYDMTTAWDKIGGEGVNEWRGSIDCSEDYNESELPDWTFDICQGTEYVCEGLLIQATNGQILHDRCGFID